MGSVKNPDQDLCAPVRLTGYKFLRSSFLRMGIIRSLQCPYTYGSAGSGHRSLITLGNRTDTQDQ